MDELAGNSQAAPPAQARALYIHVPFCRAKCRYCDFYSVEVAPAGEAEDAAHRGLAQRYLSAVAAELNMHRGDLARPLVSVFLGGGTPTVLDPEHLRRLLELVRPLTDRATEFSVEANPGTLTAEHVRTLAECGVNRVNLGVQSFRDEELALLGRIHTAAQVRPAIEAIRAAEIHNVGIDLIYGIPGQTLEHWADSLRQAQALGVQHLSCYGLSYESGTPLWRRLREGAVREVDEQEQKEMYFAAVAAAQAAGLEHYEISNFARPGRQCRHNLTYWNNQQYIGVGPAAASYCGGERWTNRPDLGAYVAALAQGAAPPADSERLEGRPAMAETVMLAVRMMRGLSRRAFADRYGRDVLEVFPRSIGRHRDLGSLEVTPQRVRIPSSWLFVADTILADIVAEGGEPSGGQACGNHTNNGQ